MDLEESAFIDGANRFQSLIYVVLSPALSGINATSVFAFVVVWNDYLFARVLLTADQPELENHADWIAGYLSFDHC
jgi:ABC-type glycerol-3-phosphate transport system permease component